MNNNPADKKILNNINQDNLNKYSENLNISNDSNEDKNENNYEVNIDIEKRYLKEVLNHKYYISDLFNKKGKNQ